MAHTNTKRGLWAALAAGTGLLLLVLLLLCDAMLSKRDTPREQSEIAMGTLVTVKLYGDGDGNASAAVFDAIRVLEQQHLSWRLESADTARINASAPQAVNVDEACADLMSRCRTLSAQAGGAFSCTVGALTSLWDIGGLNPRVPSPDELRAALATVDDSTLTVSGGQAGVAAGQKLDLGAVGKGAACDTAASVLAASNVARGVVSVGGSVLLYGDPPAGSGWKVGVRDPRGGESDRLGTLRLDGGCVSTSGDYERVLTVDGVRYHHILDPATGYPADSGLASVTVVSASGFDSDALSTACFVLGYEKSLPLLETYGAQAVFVGQDRQVRVTQGLGGRFELTAAGYTLVEP